MRRRLLLVVSIFAAACSNAPERPKVDPSARVVDPAPPRQEFGDQKRPPVDLNAARPEPKIMTADEFKERFGGVCNVEGKCNKYLVASLVIGAPPPIAKELVKMCWDVRKAATTHLRSFATELARAEGLARRAPYHSAANSPQCVEMERVDRVALAGLEKDYLTFDPETPELPEMRAALDAVGKCHGCEGAHVPQCDLAKKLSTDVMKLATAKQDAYCKDQFKSGK